RTRKRVEAETSTLKRARDGSAFTRCEGCNKDVPVVLIDMHSCSLDSKIRMSLEAQVVEKVVEPKKSTEKKRVASSSPKERKGKKEKRMKNPNKPKRPPTAFFLFMDDFRKSYKEANPGSKGGALVAKEGGAKWKSMTEEEKKPYVDKAEELRAEYDKAVKEDNAENEDADENEVSGKEESDKEGSDKEESDKEAEKKEADKKESEEEVE
ncbi:high mobility group B protein 7-like, partial [Ananas comosus]|uniref:High mobility group B protein 7-like n=1 Tax=Ananas comosus TaxID=4615 RepID=A0A6P5EDN3_ANACO